jgi:hypothetical protein
MKRTEKWTGRPERVVRVAGRGDDVAAGVVGGSMVGVALTAGLEVLCVKSASLNM